MFATVISCQEFSSPPATAADIIASCRHSLKSTRSTISAAQSMVTMTTIKMMMMWATTMTIISCGISPSLLLIILKSGDNQQQQETMMLKTMVVGGGPRHNILYVVFCATMQHVGVLLVLLWNSKVTVWSIIAHDYI